LLKWWRAGRHQSEVEDRESLRPVWVDGWKLAVVVAIQARQLVLVLNQCAEGVMPHSSKPNY